MKETLSPKPFSAGRQEAALQCRECEDLWAMVMALQVGSGKLLLSGGLEGLGFGGLV